VFVDIVLVFGNHFVSNNGVDVEKLAMFAIRNPKKIDFQKLLGGNHILNIEVKETKLFKVGGLGCERQIGPPVLSLKAGPQ